MQPSSPVLLNVAELPEVVIGANQSEYIGLPSLRSKNRYGTVTNRWSLSWRERIRVLFFGNIWHQQLTFGYPFQPTKLTTIQPGIEECL